MCLSFTAQTVSVCSSLRLLATEDRVHSGISVHSDVSCQNSHIPSLHYQSLSCFRDGNPAFDTRHSPTVKLRSSGNRGGVAQGTRNSSQMTTTPPLPKAGEILAFNINRHALPTDEARASIDGSKPVERSAKVRRLDVKDPKGSGFQPPYSEAFRDIELVSLEGVTHQVNSLVLASTW